MFRFCTFLLGLAFAVVAGGVNDVARAQTIQVRFSPLSKTSNIKPADILYHIRTDSITPEARSGQLAAEEKSYGPLLKSDKCVRKQGPSTEQDCVGLVTEWLYWGGDFSARNRIAELRGPGASTFYQNFLTPFCTKLSSESERQKGDIVAFLQQFANGSQKCMHVALVTDGGKIVSKDADGSVFLISGGNDSRKVPFKGFHFEYWRPKEKLRAEMLYDLFIINETTKKEEPQSVLTGWQPLDAKQVRGRYFLSEQYTRILGNQSELHTLEFTATKNGEAFVMNDKKFAEQIQRVLDAIKKATSNNEKSDGGITVNQFTFTITGAREEWNVSGTVDVTITAIINGKKQELQQKNPFQAVARPHQK
ncbi:MAG: hypothetical protein KDA77_08745 [Planctomycetaceae bacterium]|nr:hypothetical protein [Planctomycetaceae bacterium]